MKERQRKYLLSLSATLDLQELETVEKEVNELIKQAEAGGNEANIKSATFGEPCIPSTLTLPTSYSLGRIRSRVGSLGSPRVFNLQMIHTNPLGRF